MYFKGKRYNRERFGKKRKEEKTLLSSDYDIEILNEFYSNINLLQVRFNEKGIKVEKLAHGTILQLSHNQQITHFFPLTNQYTTTSKSFRKKKRKPKLNSVSDFEEFVFSYFNKKNIRYENELDLGEQTEYFSDEIESEKKIITHIPIIQDVNEELLKYLSKHPEFIYKLSPRKFEEVVAEILKDFGFDVKLTPQTRDGGKDILAYFKNEVTSFLTFVECKRYAPDRPVGVDIVRNVYGVQKIHKANKSLIVTTSHFTQPAMKEQELISRELELKDHLSIKEWLSNYK